MQKSDDQRVKLYVGMHNGVCAINCSDGGGSWTQGKVTSLDYAAARLAASPTQPQRAYLAAYEAGLFRTDDGGAAWESVASYPSDYAHSVLVHPEDSRTVYVGSEPAAVFRSRDGGDSWEECAGFRTVPESSGWFFHGTRLSHVRHLGMAPDDPDRLYAGIEVGGVVGSRDGGETWEQMGGTDPDIHFINLSMDRPGTVYVATAGGPYRSDDQGKSWELINAGLQRGYTVHIAAAPDDADLVLVSVSNNSQRKNAQLYRSTDGGHHWQQVEGAGSDDDMVVAMDWDPAQPGYVYAGTDRGKLFQSGDGGESWEPLPLSLPSVAVGSLLAVCG